ncbi:hypothetical protein niasHT_021766 [Heterodera trifolii]|uniref:HTH CENPB-type domain-containing protein n=1 Tax=Heterodera trifolii TaxID=157864 RepID=A0ABD2JE45_9BILA
MDERNPFASLKKVCCYCNNACSGAHQCRKCSKPCHAIAPCSFSTDDDEGFGAKVTCCNCWLSDDDDDVVMDQNANVVGTNEVTNNDHDDDAFEQFANSQITAEDNDNIDSPASSSTRKRRGYTIEEKIRILDCAKTSSIHAASRRFSLDRNTIRGWKKQEAALRKMHQLAKRKRLIGGGRKLTNAQFDQELSDWVRGLRDKKLRVTRNMIFAQAQQFCINKNMENFAASKGWLQCFMHRHNFSLRRPTTVAQKEPESYTETLIKFVLYVQQLIHNNNYFALVTLLFTPVMKRPAPDVCWNAPFKNAIREKYNDWMVNGEKPTTSTGNLKAPPMDIYLEWIASAWESIPKPLIEDSFLTCGITKEIDGRHDEKIHVFKKYGAIPNGLILLKQRRKEDAVIKGVEEIDLGEDESDASVDI